MTGPNQISTARPYPSSIAHLFAELERIDLLLRSHAANASHRGVESLDCPEQGDADERFALSPTVFAEEVQAIAERSAASVAAGIPLRLAMLAATFHLTRFDVDVLLLALAPELDLRYERLFSRIQAELGASRPTVETVLRMLGPSLPARLLLRPRFMAEAPLLRHGLVRLFTDPPSSHPSWLGCSIAADARIVAYLQGSDEISPQLRPHVQRVSPVIQLDDLILPPVLRAQLAGLVQRTRLKSKHLDIPTHHGSPANESGGIVESQTIYFHGPYGVGKRSVASALCKALGKDVLAVGGASLDGVTDTEFEEVVRLTVREAMLASAVLYYEGFERLLASDKRKQRAILLRAVNGLSGPTVISGTAKWDGTDAPSGRAFVSLELGVPDGVGRAVLWERALPGLGKPDAERLADRYRLSGGQIRDAALTAQSLAQFRDPENAVVTIDEASSASLWHSAPKLSTLAHKVKSPHSWGDLVLPAEKLAQLREIANRALHKSLVQGKWGFDSKLSAGKGLSVLFSGPPGTGKTMTAGILANELGLDLYSIDLSSIVSKYIGETEKQLAQVFAEAETGNAVLFFDEADALFGKRTEVKDAHDRYANVETSYLLQRMESFEGMTILATNYSRNMDEAFLRRLQFLVDYTLPDEGERFRIWEGIWPEAVPREADLDLEHMARRFDLSGGHIRNIALAAAFLAAAEGTAVGQRHLLHAARREYQKIGKVTEERMFAYP